MPCSLSSPKQPSQAQTARRRLLLSLGALSALGALALLTNSASSHQSTSSNSASLSSSGAVWHDHDSISSLTRRAYHTIVPKRVSHLSELGAPEPFDQVYIVSGWVDTRSLVVRKSPELVLIATTPSKGFFDRDTNQFADNPLHCYFSVRSYKTGKTRHHTRPSVLQPQDAPDGHPGQSPWMYAQYICPLETEEGKPIPGWEDAEIFATLSLAQLDPLHNSFVRVESVPTLDLKAHKAGEGISAMCMPPLSGDFYAPFLSDYFAHYRALGFSRFYPYLLDPGPETLKVLRQVMYEQEGIEPVRWGVPKQWLKPTSRVPDPVGAFSVPPVDWHIDGIDNQPPEVEINLAAPAGGPDSVKLWYFGQGPATQDCAYRAMQAGARWMMAPDYDEWLLLRPPGGHDWPPPGTTHSGSISSPPPRNKLLTAFAQSVVPVLTTAWVHWYPPAVLESAHQRLLKQGALASGYQFRSAFHCMSCRPANPPTHDNLGARAVQKVLGDDFEWTAPGLRVPFAYSSPVRHMEWFREGRRTKTLVDPWAWRMIGIHVATMTYLEWAVAAGPCSWSEFKSAPPRRGAEEYDYGSECAFKYLDAFGPATYLVDPGDTASNSTTSVAPTPHSRGGLVHVRVSAELRESLVRHEQVFGLGEGHELTALDLEPGAEERELDRQERMRRNGRRVVEHARVGPGEAEWRTQHREGEFGKGGPTSWPRLELVEDWSFAEIMGRVLAERLSHLHFGTTKAKHVQSTTGVEAGGAGLPRWVWIPWLGLGAFLVAGWNKQRKRSLR